MFPRLGKCVGRPDIEIGKIFLLNLNIFLWSEKDKQVYFTDILQLMSKNDIHFINQKFLFVSDCESKIIIDWHCVSNLWETNIILIGKYFAKIMSYL